jgi:uncharacterized protein (TIGR03435 family)
MKRRRTLARSRASLTLICATLACAAAALAAQAMQTGVGSAAFDVASVKRYQPAAGRPQSNSISVMPGGRFTAPSATLRGLIAAGYGILDFQIVDGDRIPANDRFEIEATTKADVTVEQARAMVRTLLADRFRLSAHTEIRELPVYVLTVSRGDRRLGDQLRPAGPDCAPVKGPPGLPPPPPPPPSENIGRILTLSGPPLRCGGLRYSSTSGEHLSLRNLTIADLAGRLIGTLGRPVLDRTGLEGSFDVDLTYTLEARVDIDASNAPNAPALPTAMREQLGLRVESARAPVEVLVIDGVSSPTEN